MPMQTLNALQQTVLEDAQPRSEILGVGASPRKGGNSDVLLAHILKGARDNKVVGCKVHLREMRFSACIGCEQCRRDRFCTGLVDGMTLLYPEIQKAKGLVLVSPTHNYNITSWMKAFIDRLYCFYVFANSRPRSWSSRLAGQGRKAVLAAVCEQVDQQDMGFTLAAMRLPLEALGYEIVGELPVYGIFDRGKVKDNEEALASAHRLGAELAHSLMPHSAQDTIRNPPDPGH